MVDVPFRMGSWSHRLLVRLTFGGLKRPPMVTSSVQNGITSWNMLKYHETTCRPIAIHSQGYDPVAWLDTVAFRWRCSIKSLKRLKPFFSSFIGMLRFQFNSSNFFVRFRLLPGPSEQLRECIGPHHLGRKTRLHTSGRVAVPPPNSLDFTVS